MADPEPMRAPPGPRLRLPRAQRVRKRAEFVRIQESPVRVTTRHLLVLLARGGALAPGTACRSGPAEAGAPRLGVVASRKVGPAVARNRAKRLVREVFRLHPEAFPAGLDVVIIVRPGTHLLGLSDLEAEVAGAAHLLARRARELCKAGPR